MREKVNGVYQPLYPQTYWQQVIGADNQITTVNNRISTVQSNLQRQINNKMDANTYIPRVVSGSYTGNGEANMFINLGFSPSAVLLFAGGEGVAKLIEYYEVNNDQYNQPREAVLCVQGQTYKNSGQPVISVGTNGFTVYYYNNTATAGRGDYYILCLANNSGIKYNYIAVS